MRASRTATYQPSVAERVGWLCSMHAEAKPLDEKRVPVPPSLLPPGAPPATFSGGQFLTDISNNWLDGKVATRLSSEEMSQVESLGWFGAWRDGVERLRANRNRAT